MKTPNAKTGNARVSIYCAGKEGAKWKEHNRKRKGGETKIIPVKGQADLEYVAQKNLNATKCQTKNGDENNNREQYQWGPNDDQTTKEYNILQKRIY